MEGTKKAAGEAAGKVSLEKYLKDIRGEVRNAFGIGLKLTVSLDQNGLIANHRDEACGTAEITIYMPDTPASAYIGAYGELVIPNDPHAERAGQ